MKRLTSEQRMAAEHIVIATAQGKPWDCTCFPCQHVRKTDFPTQMTPKMELWILLCLLGERIQRRSVEKMDDELVPAAIQNRRKELKRKLGFQAAGAEKQLNEASGSDTVDTHVQCYKGTGGGKRIIRKSDPMS